MCFSSLILTNFADFWVQNSPKFWHHKYGEKKNKLCQLWGSNLYPNWILWLIQVFFNVGQYAGQYAGSMFVSLLSVPLGLSEFIVGNTIASLGGPGSSHMTKRVFMQVSIVHFVWILRCVCFELGFVWVLQVKFNILNYQKWFERHTVWNFYIKHKLIWTMFTFWTNFNLKHNWFH